ncbi:hypothetical protein ACNKHP_10430 [Shigella boydii]
MALLPGFAFLGSRRWLRIVQHLIHYQQGDTYGRVFIVGLLNTPLRFLHCVLCLLLFSGFFIGLARLSDNWLLRKLSTIILRFRNISPLLQIFFWDLALRNLPGPRQAVQRV